MDEILTPREAAARRGVTVATIYRAIADGRLPARRVLQRLAVSASDADAFEAGSYRGVKRATRRRGPGRGRDHTLARPAPVAASQQPAHPVQPTPGSATADLLRRWIEEGEESEQRQTLEFLKRALNQSHSSSRKVFP